MATLYEINEKLKALETYGVDLETGELLEDEDFAKLFNELQMDYETKVENTLCFIKNLLSDVEAFKKEAENLKQRAKSKENLAMRLKANIDYMVDGLYLNDDNSIDIEKKNKYKFETPKCKLSYRKSDVVDVFDIDKIPKEFINVKIEESPNKTAMKKYLKENDDNKIDGVILKTNLSMQIK